MKQPIGKMLALTRLVVWISLGTVAAAGAAETERINVCYSSIAATSPRRSSGPAVRPRRSYPRPRRPLPDSSNPPTAKRSPRVTWRDARDGRSRGCSRGCAASGCGTARHCGRSSRIAGTRGRTEHDR